MEISFSSAQELYQRTKPALLVKVREFRRSHIYSIKEKDIWEYLSKNKWNQVSGLSLAKMVEDILELDSNKILEYFSSSTEVI